MSLTYAQMKSLLHEIRPLLKGAVLDRCSASSHKKLILHFSNQLSLLICFQEPFLRFHLTQHEWKNHSTAFSQQLAQALHNWHLRECELLEKDRILKLFFKKGQEETFLVCELIPKRANGYLLDGQERILTSLIPTEKNVYQMPTRFFNSDQETAEIVSSAAIEQVYNPLEWQAEFLEKKQEIEKLLKNQIKNSLKAKSRFSQELAEASQWEKVQHEAKLLQSNLFRIKRGIATVTLHDWLQDREVEIDLDPTLLPADEITKRFQKSKKLRKGITPLKQQLEKAEQNLEKTSSLLDQLQQIESEKKLTSFCQENRLLPKAAVKHSQSLKSALPYREFITESGFQIWVGKSAKDNDKLTFSHAHGSDYWFHAHDVPGSHVVLRLKKQAEPDEESIQDAVQAALYYSKAKNEQAGEVCMTRCKYVSRFGRNQPGKVQISEHRIIYAKADPTRLKRLRSHSSQYL